MTESRAQVDAERSSDGLKTARLGLVEILRCESATKNVARGTWRHFRSNRRGVDEKKTDTNHGRGRSRRRELKGYSN